METAEALTSVGINYSGDAGDLDRSAYAAAAERPGRPVRIRIQPSLFRARDASTPGNNYVGWRGVSWTLECPTAEDAIQVRKAMQAFFAAVRLHGARAVEKALLGATTK